jgi:RNA polymerase sigma-70 factor (ECF subfamily)
MNEQEAINRLRRGQISGLATLVERYQVQAVRVAYLITQDQDLAKDAVQNAFLRVHRSIGSYDVLRPFAPWLMRIVVNCALKAARGRGIWQGLTLKEEALEDAWLDALPDPAPSPHDAVEAAEIDRAVWSAVQALRPEQRAVIAMRYYLDLSEGEMAESLHVPEGTVKSRLHAARNALRKLLTVRLPEWER